jgi:ABC-2 type transport system permease protein
MSMGGNLTALSNTIKLLIIREWRRVFMEPSRLIGVLLQPLLFLAVFGAGFHDNFLLKDQKTSYVSFFFPGILGLVVLFASIYATLTLVDDKKCGFFRLVLCGPGGVLGAVIGKVLATASLGFAQSVLFLGLLIFLPLTVTQGIVLWAVVLLAVGSVIFAVMGVLCAWLSPSPSAFHALMSVLLIPMWLLSGAMFPLSGVFYWASFINPMAYMVTALRDNFLDATPAMVDLFGLVTCLVFLCGVLGLAIKRRVMD